MRVTARLRNHAAPDPMIDSHVAVALWVDGGGAGTLTLRAEEVDQFLDRVQVDAVSDERRAVAPEHRHYNGGDDR